ncbi:hypothetical protein AC578_9531 [Lecanosticta acicola]|uniref:CCHC-type domain-containing protein n=1 Tax=Lecanosticta acicola TaxID=111012 RepID=A0AAI9EF73_9PEZI|nr:hypothetical protein AC578_9531 [Lecanosticta acicola]
MAEEHKGSRLTTRICRVSISTKLSQHAAASAQAYALVSCLNACFQSISDLLRGNGYGNSSYSRQDPKNIKCHHCGNFGHIPSHCPDKNDGQGRKTAADTRAGAANAGARIHYSDGPRYNSGPTIKPDLQKALRDANAYASTLARSNDQCRLSKAKADNGLRTSFFAPDTTASVAANFSTVNLPQNVYVYKVEMVRAYTEKASTILVKRSTDRKAVMRVLHTQANLVLELQLTPKTWVTDGDLIWSTRALFSSANLPRQLMNLVYQTECGQQLTVEEVTISHQQTIGGHISMAELVQNTQATEFHESVAGVFVRGVNAFLTEHARNTGTNTLTSGSRSFDHNTTSPLGNHGLRALHLSARPGVDRLLINISTAFTPFYGLDSIRSFINSSGRSPNALRKILKGVRVRIDYEISGGWQPATSCYRFVHGFGEQINQHRLESQTKLYDWFCRPTAEERSQPLYPRNLRPNLMQPGHLSVKVSVDPRRCPSSLEWYPASVLEIFEFQAFHDALKPDETSAMIQSAPFQPAQNRQRILGQGLTKDPRAFHGRVKDELRDSESWRPYHLRAYADHERRSPPMKYGFLRRNPWHESLDDIMFYL